jgi:glycosyltransferase involved in cell wall biosynthesis
MSVSPKRVLYFCRGGPVYGSQRQLLALVTHLDRASFEPVVVCSGGGELAERLMDRGVNTIEHIRLHPSRKLVHLTGSVLDRYALWRQFRLEGIDLIHCSYLWHNPYAVWLARKLRCPSIAHIRGPVEAHSVKACLCHHANGLIAISPRSAASAIEAGIGRERIAIISDSVDTGVFRPMPESRAAVRKAMGLGNGFVFGMVGRVSSAKFVLEFLEAAAVVARERPGSMFLIVGDERDGGHARLVREYVDSRGLREQVILAGHRDDIADVLNCCDVLVTLAGGSIMYEAMACGVPVLSAGFTRREDSVHVLNDRTGIVLESRAANEVAMAMMKLMDDRQYRDGLGSEALKHVAEHLVDRVMAEKTQQVYERLLAEKA